MDATCLCIERTNDVVVATTAAPQFTEAEAQELVDELIGCIRYDSVHFFVLDFAAVEQIHSACVDALLTLYQELEHVRGRVVLANCGASVFTLLETTRLDAMFEVFEDLDEAVASVTL